MNKDQIEARINELKAKAQMAKGDIKAKYEEEVQKLEAQKEVLVKAMKDKTDDIDVETRDILGDAKDDPEEAE